MTELTAPIHHIIGPTILLGSGAYFDFDNPEGSQLTIEDVAYGLAFQSRFSGQCVSRRTGKRVYYSVAQHRIIMAGHAEPGSKMAALMHEVGEATCGDMSSPLKSKCPDFKAVEKRCEAAGLSRFRVKTPSHTYIKHLDLCMLATEQRDLMPVNGHTWETVEGRRPFEAEIFPWENPHFAAEAFLETYRQLGRSGQ